MSVVYLFVCLPVPVNKAPQWEGVKMCMTPQLKDHSRKFVKLILVTPIFHPFIPPGGGEVFMGKLEELKFSKYTLGMILRNFNSRTQGVFHAPQENLRIAEVR